MRKCATIPGGGEVHQRQYPNDIPVHQRNHEDAAGGQRVESGIGLYFYNARWYDAQLGRWIQADAMIPDPGDSQAWDRYAYTNNNPVKYIDPSGHDLEQIIFNRTGKLPKEPSRPPQQLQIEEYSDWYSGNYSGCTMCHYAHAQNESILTNDELAIADENYREWATVGYTPLVVTTVTVSGLQVAGFSGGSHVIETGTNTVYRVVERGLTKYIGITIDFARRSAEHLADRGWRIEPIQKLQNLSRFDARAVEQVLIERLGITNLYNQINSISTQSPIYNQAIDRGREILEIIGFK